MLRKVGLRVTERRYTRERSDAKAWAEERAVDATELLRAIDATLWDEAAAWATEFESHASQRLRPVGFDLGGGGHYPLLYFLTRRMRPEVVVETGVAAGWSSVAILSALERNGAGTLLSSDFPYFRLPDPERFVGWLVPQGLRHRWQLDIDGDRKALPRFMRSAPSVDLFHYDSDKTDAGRRFAMNTVGPYLSPGAVVVMDDIADNNFFRDYVAASNLRTHVFKFEAKYLGVIGLDRLLSESA
jgi:predicted O-methyltransferase YrrM